MNPERIDNPLWEAILKSPKMRRWSGWHLKRQFKDERDRTNSGEATWRARESDVPPPWCWERMGQTRTELPDGRVVFVAGEHEDFYDPDFCIFNDVVVEHPDGALEIYAYPLEAFPPTDFHTATLIDDAVILIGNLGYRDTRRPGRCQVARLDLASFRIDLIDCAGPSPGWLNRHGAERLGESEILVFGGRLIEAGPDGEETPESPDNAALHALDITTWTWRPVPHADESVFPVSAEDYRAGRAPVIGTANPEKLDHAFKREAARVGWPPRRSRLHFSDPAEKRREEESPNGPPRPIGEVVWTAARRGAAEVALKDGARLRIAGELSDFRDDWPDRWVYNDVIRFGPDGGVEIYAYPLDVLPPLIDAAAFEENGRVLVVGTVWHRFAPLARRTAALALDPDAMSITMLDTIAIRGRVFLDAPHVTIAPDAISFRAMKLRHEDPERFLRFDRRSDRWVAPEA